ncbi:multiubiquitin domain-containing protein [Actinophytocola glycyrrhizae]|uniref:Multiubiquitin domain-containing protein n=1 Tax=Actinophytocola glycyrrhizae TaxID=2044873 RepID=A0ABV9SFF0_9PSEU
MTHGKPDHDRPDQHFNIQIDREHFKVAEPKLTGTQLRQLPNPDIPADRDLYEVRPGDDDLLIEDSIEVEMRNGLRFFTAPGQINPGAPVK